MVAWMPLLRGSRAVALAAVEAGAVELQQLHGIARVQVRRWVQGQGRALVVLDRRWGVLGVPSPQRCLLKDREAGKREGKKEEEEDEERCWQQSQPLVAAAVDA